MEPKNGTKETLLFTPLKIRGITLKNRISVSPMCQYSCVDGFVNDWHLVHLGARAIGGAGMVFVEATGVEARGRISPSCPGLWKDDQIEPMARIVKFLKSQGSVAAIQLGHAGRKASTFPPWIGRNSISDELGGWETIGPSPIAFGNGNTRVPKEATIEDINDIKNAFVLAAKRALKAGFQVIELHFAHGYLVSSFLSPITNKRTDKYGGSFQNRIRLAIEIVENVRQVLPEDFPLGVRISFTDYVENGWDLMQSIELSKQLKKVGIDFVDCSSGGVSAQVVLHASMNNVDQIPAAEAIQKEARIATAAVGKIVDPFWAEDILQKGKATLIMIGRAFLDDPNWPLHAAFELGADQQQFKLPNQYIWAIGSNTGGKWRETVLKDKNNNELEVK